MINRLDHLASRGGCVSLTSELTNPSSPLAHYLTKRFPHRGAIADTYAAAVSDAPTVTPAAGGGYPWALVGSAFGHRLGFAFAADPPYAALLGATQLTDTEQVAHLAAAQFATARTLADGDVHRAGYVRVVVGDRCLLLPSADDAPELDAAQWAAPDPTVQPHLELFAQLAERVQGPLPPGRPRPERAAEHPLLAECWWLACYEALYRSGRCPQLTSALGRLGPAATAEALRQLTPKAVGEDLRRLTVALAERGYDQLAVLGGPVTVAPLFVQHWAEGDLVLGGTLVEVKVAKQPLPLRDEWLNQLLGYVLLDRGDWYGLRQVAVFLGRQARLVAWPLPELLPSLTGDPLVTLAELRAEFHELLERVWANDPRFPFHHLWATRTLPPWRPPLSANDVAEARVARVSAQTTVPPTQPTPPRSRRPTEPSEGGRAARIRDRLARQLERPGRHA
jgi:hypothetical protein